MTSLRLVSFNACSGRSMEDGVADAGRLADAVAGLGADVVALQEVDRFQPRSGGADQAAVVAKALGGAAFRYLGLVHGTPGEPGWLPAPDDHPAAGHDTDDGTADPTYGIALLSTRPVAEWHVLRLRPARGRYPIPVPSRPPRVLWIPDEPRAVVAAVLAEPRMTVAATHLSFAPGANVRQLRAVKRWLATFPGPHVLLGDLNLPGGLPGRITRWTPLATGPTFPSPAPRIQLDHLLAHGLPEGTRVEGRVERLAVSDHRAVVADLALPF